MTQPIKHVCKGCGKNKKFRADQLYCSKECLRSLSAPSPKVQVTEKELVDIKLQELRDKKEGKDDIIKELTGRLLAVEAENDVFKALKESKPEVTDILPKVSSGKSESAAVLVWSDWHIEERVYPEQVSNKNTYNLKIANERFLKLLHGGMSWLRIAGRDTQIRTIVLALLGDFITGSIHEDLAESNELPPAEAIHKAYGMIVSGIKFMLENTERNVSFVIPCHSGNHGRMTKDQRISTESGNSLEYFMYLMLRDYFQTEKRLKFVVQSGYHSYVRFFEGVFDARFHHGHQINYQGGVGGITIPVNKAISQWNKAVPDIKLDVFGHFHQRFDGGSFICNGSLVGYNSYGVSIKAAFEPPSQTIFLVNREYAAKTLVAPIFV